MASKDLYKTLGVSKNASDQDIKKVCALRLPKTTKTKPNSIEIQLLFRIRRTFILKTQGVLIQ